MLRVLAFLFFREGFSPLISSVEKMRQLRAELLVQMRRVEKSSKIDIIRDIEVCKTYFTSFDIAYKTSDLAIEIGRNASILIPEFFLFRLTDFLCYESPERSFLCNSSFFHNAIFIWMVVFVYGDIYNYFFLKVNIKLLSFSFWSMIVWGMWLWVEVNKSSLAIINLGLDICFLRA